MDAEWIKKRLGRQPGQRKADLARALSLDPSAITKILSGARKIQLHEADRIREFFGETVKVPPGDGTMTRVSTDINVQSFPRDMPVRGSAACGEDGMFEINVADPIDYVRRPPRLAGIRDAYALYVTGDSMSPWRENGKLVYVHPHQPPQVGDYVVVQLKPKKPGDSPAAFVKRLLRRSEREVRVLQHNPREERTFKTADILSIHRILEWDELLGI